MSKSKRTNIPNVISGGIATPLGNNMYLMIGRTHEQGGIDIGNTKRGLEVENGEVLKTNKKSVKVFSAKPILNGNSPAELVIKGINPENVFNAQEKFKDENHLKDDGTSARLGRFSRVKQNDSPTKEISSGYEDYVNKTISKHGSFPNSKKYYIPYLYDKEIKVRGAGRMSSNMLDSIAVNANKANNSSTGRQPKAASGFSIGSDLIRGAADLAGSIVSYKINKDMIDKMRINNYVPYQRYKLKTNYSINPQLDSSREQINSMIDESKHNTASSRTDLARRQRYRNLGIRNTNELYGQKENIETQLINQDILNAQRTSQQNTQLVNDYLRRKAEMDNKLAELNAENKVSLAQNAAGVVGDYFDRRETRNREALDRAIIAASNPNAISYMDNELPKLARQFGYRPLSFNFGRFRKNK